MRSNKRGLYGLSGWATWEGLGDLTRWAVTYRKTLRWRQVIGFRKYALILVRADDA